MTTAETKTPAVEMREVQKTLGGKTILNGVSLAVAAGETVALLGRSGCGKTTLLRTVNMLAPPDAGTLRVCGEEIQIAPPDEKQLKQLRARAAMVFQHFNLWARLTALENAMEAPVHALGIAKEEARARAEESLARVGLAARAGHYPAQLSGGQKQRVAIARALAMRPDIVLMDEPTSALDPESVGEVLAVVRELAQGGATMIIATHEMSFARDAADRAVFLEKGKILSEGAPAEVLNDPHLKNFAQE